MIKYLKLLTLATGEKVLTLASDEEVKSLQDILKQKAELVHQRNVESGSAQWKKSDNAQKIKEEEARLQNFSFTPPERARHEARLESLKEEKPILEKEVFESAKRYRLALEEWRESEKNFKDTHVAFNSVDDE